MAEFEVANVVGTITYRQELALEAFAATFSERDEITNVKYEPAENHWLKTWFAPDDTYVAFYRSGRCSIVGADSFDNFEEVTGRVNAVMHDILGFDYEPKIEVSNVVATAEVNSNISLEHLALKLGMESIEYEPEQFPALMYRGSDHVILVFASGKLVCTGLTEIKQISEAIGAIMPKLQEVSQS